MATSPGFQVSQYVTTVRMVQGYRFLDRCGDALIRLENSLGAGWMPDDVSPKGGQLKNDQLAMGIRFDAESITVLQVDFFDFGVFADIALRATEILIQTFGVDRVLSPAFNAVFQIPAPDTDAAENILKSFKLATASPTLIDLFGEPSSFEFVMTNESDGEWKESFVRQRKRIRAVVITQVKQAGFDDRLVKRVRLLPEKQREALHGIAELRKRMVAKPAVAVQVELERAFESEFPAATFDLPEFVFSTEKWQRETIARIQRGA